LLTALGTDDGNLNALFRHASSAYLNAASGGVDSPLSTGDVIAIVCDGIATGQIEAAKNELAAANQLGCPLN
jgi:hypothetical protein